MSDRHPLMWAEKVTRDFQITQHILVTCVSLQPSSIILKIISYSSLQFEPAKGIDILSISSDTLKKKMPLKMKYRIYAGNGVYET